MTPEEAIAEIWGTVCPDAGPHNHAETVKAVAQLQARADALAKELEEVKEAGDESAIMLSQLNDEHFALQAKAYEDLARRLTEVELAEVRARHAAVTEIHEHWEFEEDMGEEEFDLYMHGLIKAARQRIAVLQGELSRK